MVTDSPEPGHHYESYCSLPSSLTSELMESYYISNLSMAVWALVLGIPLFILISWGIVLGDRIIKKQADTDEETAVLRPIRERI